MRLRIIVFAFMALLAFVTGTSRLAHAQVFDKTYGKSLIIAGNGGTDLTNTLTISAPSLLLNPIVTLPSTNTPGCLLDVLGNGIFSWTPVSLVNLVVGLGSTYLTTNGSSSVGWVGLSTNATLSGNGMGTSLAVAIGNANTWTALQNIQRNSIGTTPTDGLDLTNNTAANILAQQQYSPRFRLSGQGWKTSATAGSQEVDWTMQAIPVAGSSNPTSYLDIGDQVNGGGYMSDFDLFSSGGATLGITSPSDPGAGVLNVGSGFEVKGAAPAGTILEGNGQVFTASSALFPSAGSAQNILRSNGTSFASVAVNTGQFQPADPTGTQNSSGVMMGLGLSDSIKPNGSGIVMVIVSGSIVNTAGSGLGPFNNSNVQIRYGSGTAPSNGVAAAGTAVGNMFMQQSHNNTNQEAFTMSAIVSGLSLNTKYWFDLWLQDVTDPNPQGPVNISNVSISIVEL